MSEEDTQTNAPGEADALRAPNKPSPLTAPTAPPGVGAEDTKKPGAAGDRPVSDAAVEFAAQSNGYVTDYIKFGDAKAGAVLSFTAVVAGAAVSSATSSFDLLRSVSTIALAAGALLLLCLLALALGVAWACVSALDPRTPKGKSLHSFPDVSEMDAEVYEAQLRGLDAHAATREYAMHTKVLSAIALQKFESIGSAVRRLRWMLLVAAAYAAVVGEAHLLADHADKPKTVIVVPGAAAR